MKTSSKLYKLQHAEALDITKILDEVINNQKQIKQKLQKTVLQILLKLIMHQSHQPLGVLKHPPIVHQVQVVPIVGTVLMSLVILFRYLQMNAVMLF